MVVLAHGSGVDDVLWFLVPVVLALIVVRRAERRAKASLEQDSVQTAAAPASPEQ